MTDLAIALRIRVNNDGLVQVLDASGEKVEEFGRKGKRAGDQASQGMEKARRSSGLLSSALGRVTLAAGAAFAAIFSISTASAAFGAVIGNTITAEQSLTQLEARVEATGAAANRSTEQLVAHSAALQDISIFGDETIQVMQSVLLTFTQIRDVNFDRATESVLDIATVMGTDLQSAALQVGKALNDPKRGLDGLQRSGIQFNETQKALINSLVETGNVAAAQGVILEELETQFGGAAAAARGTLGGAIQALRNAFGDLLEFQGDLPALSAGIEELITSLKDPELAASIQSGLGAVLETIPPALELTVQVGTGALQIVSLLAENWQILELALLSVAGVIVGRVVAALWAKVAAVLAATAGITSMTAAQLRLSAALAAAAVQMRVVASATRAASAAFALIGGPVGALAIAIGGAVVISGQYKDKLEELRQPSQALTADLIALNEAANRPVRFDLDLRPFEETIARIEAEILKLESRIADIDRIRQEQASNRSPNSLLGSFVIRNPEAIALEEQLTATRGLLDQAQIEYRELLEARTKAWAELPQQEREAFLIEQLGQAAEFAAPLLSRLGIEYEGFLTRLNQPTIDPAEVAKFTAPLEQQAQALREQIIQLTAGQAVLDAYRDAQILTTAAQKDAEEGTTAYTRAAREQIQQLRTLREAIRIKTEQRATEAAAEAAAEQAATELLQAYSRMQGVVDPLAARQAELNEQIQIFERALTLSTADLEQMGISSDTVRLILDRLYGEFERLGEVDLSGPREYLQNLEEQLEAVRAGPAAMREYNLQQQIKNDLEALGLGNLEELTPEQRRYREEIERTAEAMQTASQFQDLFGTIGQGISTAVLNGASLSDALGQSLTAGGAQFLSEGIQDAISRGLTRAFETFEISEAGQQQISAALPGVALGIGQALQGQLGQGIGSAVGAIAGSFIPGIGTALGSVLGGLVGGLFDGGSTPKFQVSGTGRQRDLGVDESITGELGVIEFSFREIEAEARQQIIKAFVQFDTSLAAVIRDQDLLAAATEALKDFDVSSRSDGESIEVLLQERLRLALTAFEGSVQSIVLERNTLEEQFQALADVQSIRAAVENVRGLGLGFEETLAIVNELADPGQSLGEAFLSLQAGFNGLNTVLGTLGFTIEGQQEDLLRYVDTLTEAAGGTQELDRLFNRFWSTFFTDAEVAQQDAITARDRATTLLGQLGLDENLIDDPEAFRSQFAELLPTLSPEDAATLLQISDAIADVIDAERALADAREAALQPTRDLAALMAEAEAALIRADLSPFQNELVSIQLEGLSAADAMRAAAEAAGLSEAASDSLADVHEITERRIRAAIARLEETGRGLVGQLFGTALDDLNDRIDQLQTAATNATSGVGQLVEGLGGLADSLLIGNLSPLTGGDRLAEAQRQFDEAIASGDRSEAERLSQIVLQLAQDRFASGQQFTDIFNDVQGALRGFVGRPDDVQTVRNPQLEALIRERDTLEAEQRALEQTALGRELAQVVADLAQAQELSFEDIAQSLNFDLSALADVLGLDMAGLEDFLGSLQVDTLDVAETVFSLEQAVTDQLIEANNSLNEIADSLRVFRVPEGPQPPPGGIPGPTPPGSGGSSPAPTPPGDREDAQLPRQVIDAANGTTGAVEAIGRAIVEAVNNGNLENQAVADLLQRILDALEDAGESRGNTVIAR